MATKKTAYVNKPFPQKIREEASLLIKAGEIYDGKFWCNRDKTCKRMGYDSWKSLSEELRSCVNQIGRAASKRGKEKAKREAEAQTLPLDPKPITKPLLSKEILGEIALGNIKVPKATSPHVIKIIRTYVTIQAGFDPKKTLLGIASLMEP